MDSVSGSSIWDLLPDNISLPIIRDDRFWEEYLTNAKDMNVHVAILSKHYLKKILSRSKTIESRFSKTRRRPYNRVSIGDIILLKESGGTIQGICLVSNVWFFELRQKSLSEIKNEYGERLQIDDSSYWERYAHSQYATLIELKHACKIPATKFKKRDQNAWVTFEPLRD